MATAAFPIPARRTIVGPARAYLDLCGLPDSEEKSVARFVRRFNNDLGKVPRFLPKIKQSREALCDSVGLSPEAYEDTDPIIRRFGVVDALARRCKRWAWVWGLVLLALPALGLILFDWSHVWQPEHHWLKTVAIACWVFSALIMLVVWERRVVEMHLMYRALAEALRVKLLWRLCGVPDLVHDKYLKSQEEKLLPVCHALRVWSEQQEPSRLERLANEVPMRWVRAGKIYFSNNAIPNEKWNKLCVTIGRMLYLVGLLAAVLGIRYEDHHDPAHWIFYSVAGAFIIGAACFLGYAERHALSEQARTYARMCDLFAIAENDLQEDKTGAKRHEILRRLGCDALAHNADWVLMHLERPLEMRA
jgi:hypothetical protein